MTLTLSYSYDPTTLTGQVRAAVGDTPSDQPAALTEVPRVNWPCAFADEEIATALAAHNGGIWETAAALCLQQAARVLRLFCDKDGVARSAGWRALYDLCQAQANSLPAEAWVETLQTDFQAREALERAYYTGTLPHGGW